MELLQKRRDLVFLFLFKDKTIRAILDALKTIDKRSGKSSKKGVTIVKTRENGRSDKFGCSVCGKVLARKWQCGGAESNRCKTEEMCCFMERVLSKVTPRILTIEDRETDESESSRESEVAFESLDVVPIRMASVLLLFI